MNTQTQNTRTLRELIGSLSPEAEGAKLPSPAHFRKNGEAMLAEIPGLRVSRGGCAAYENASGRSVFRIRELNDFTFRFQGARPGEKAPVPSSCTVPKEMLESLPWYIPLTLMGEYRVEFNRRIHCREYSLDGLDPEERDQLLNRAAPADPGRCENPEATLIREENRREMLACLTGRQREIFTLCCLEGLSRGEIAERLGMARSAVSRTLNRALDRIRLHNFN